LPQLRVTHKIFFRSQQAERWHNTVTLWALQKNQCGFVGLALNQGVFGGFGRFSNRECEIQKKSDRGSKKEIEKKLTLLSRVHYWNK